MSEERKVGGTVAVSQVGDRLRGVERPEPGVPESSAIDFPWTSDGVGRGTGFLSGTMIADKDPLVPVFWRILVADLFPATYDDDRDIEQGEPARRRTACRVASSRIAPEKDWKFRMRK